MDNLQNIIKRIKTICQEENLKVSDNTILEQATDIYLSKQISESNKEIQTMKNKSNDKLATEKQKGLMTKLKIPFTDKTTIKEAKELIESKLGKKNEYYEE